ncbi:hypothetical protein GCM10027271_42890 [Saccharopolyspora gloriosae]|uniref:DUF397 domain-containing protein n=1 Tax=Saccharopolyspora gloriosae TaxID=455344 RepID=A0A840NJS8_9PSEU|nr:hypothetical protein [Saccharopolyspora gloriosae]
MKFANWKKSSRSGTSGGNCVEVGFAEGARALRDTKDRAAGYFVATSKQWTTFVNAIKTGRYDI